MNDKVLHTLRTVFGYEQFRGQQAEIISQLIAGNDVLVLMPTGGGKSLCFQIPALLMDGVAIVISPLIALMEDQVNALHQLGIRAAFLNSTLSLDEVRQIEAQLQQGALDLLYMAPERLNNERTLSLFTRTKIALFAIDEAHCVSQWGHDFRADYLQLSLLQQRFPDVPRIALTATADNKTRAEIIQRLGLEQAKIFVSGFDRPNIRYRIVHKQQARQQLLQFIQQEHAGDAGIVYCLSRKKVEATAEWLNEKGITALPYHAGMSNELRQRHQQRFIKEEGLVIVATIAFGMGIDKPNVRFVAHLDLPKSIEAYYQETGRAGRDGLPANAWMAYGLQDVISLRQMMAGSNANETHRRLELHKLDAMLALCETIHCRRQDLLAYFGDMLEAPCGNCDTCLEPVKTWDGTVAAQQALSCIYRTGQRFGASYLIDVLRGKDNDRIRHFGHDKQSTFGIGKELDEQRWRSVFRQLVARGLIEVDFEGFGAFKLTEACRPVLRGEQTLMLRSDIQVKKARSGTSRKVQPDNPLWEALRAKRREIAQRQDVPPYVIFHDATLMEMVAARPKTLSQMAHVSGVGERKLALYGDEFIAVIQQFSGVDIKEKSSDTVQESLDLFRLGYTAEQIAEQRELKADTIYRHLSVAIEQGQIALSEVVSLPDSEIDKLQDAILSLPDDQNNRLKPVYEQFSGVYSYGILHCVKASLTHEIEASSS
ncbi:DNA helicase RecQ [methane-oxidizing endosymbiont of Gigantopelta aegis]|uniref:DNA helicase RecQ n=1 Tax=methane-oxidizing endosymbiont of Gigantopelta aegis TaxID=2794938 RepID=UPI0018DD82D2|nr:DNA helicase RecQ [methane-oxidizing endosymbiont of Gigantopelta aegis]